MFQKWISYPSDKPQNRHPNIHKARERKKWSTKDRTRVWNEGTSWSFWPLDDVMCAAMLENKCTDTRRSVCLASSPSGTRGCRSCSGTPSGQPSLHLHPHPMLSLSPWELTMDLHVPCQTSSARPSCTCLDARRCLPCFAWSKGRGRSSTPPSSTSQTPYS